MRAILVLLVALGSTALATGDGGALSWPEAILAVANTHDVTSSADGTQVHAPCARTCTHVGIPTATADVDCLPAPYGCPFLWEATGVVRLRVEHLATGEWCEVYFPPPAGWCALDAGTVRFTLTAVSPHSESVISFH